MTDETFTLIEQRTLLRTKLRESAKLLLQARQALDRGDTTSLHAVLHGDEVRRILEDAMLETPARPAIISPSPFRQRAA